MGSQRRGYDWATEQEQNSELHKLIIPSIKKTKKISSKSSKACCLVARASQMTQWQRICLQCRRLKRHGFEPWLEKMPWRGEWQPTSAFLCGKSHIQRSLVGYSLWGCKRVGHNRATTHTHTRLVAGLWWLAQVARLSLIKGFSCVNNWEQHSHL